MGTYELKEPPITVQSVEALAPAPIITGRAEQAPALHTAPRPRATTDALVGMRRELDTYWSCMRGFASMEPDQVLIALSAYTSRVGEMRKNCWRDGGRLASKLRTEEIDPFIEECDRQFKFHSRLQSMRELDWRMTTGAPS